MPSYYFSFKCDVCDGIAVAPILGVNSLRQEELLAKDMTYDASCNKGHKSTYFRTQIVEVHRKLSPLEKQMEPELLGDDRFVDID